MAKEVEKKETHETKNIYEKLMIFQGKGISFEKSASNPFFKSKYTPLDDINLKIKPILTELGLLVFHSVEEGKVTTTIINCHNTEESIHSVSVLPIGVNDPQKVGSAITYYRRYNIVALLNLDSETDGDGNNTQSKNAVKEPTKKPFDKEAQDAFKNAIIGDKYPLPSTIDLLYKDLEKRYILTKENKDMLVPLYEVIEETKKETL